MVLDFIVVVVCLMFFSALIAFMFGCEHL